MGGILEYTILGRKKSALPLLPQNMKVDEKLLSDVVHKIKNGLGAIGGFAALLERDIKTDDPRRRLVQRIQDGVEKVNSVVVDLMTLARMVEPSFEKIHLESLIKEAWESTLDKEENQTSGFPFHFNYLDGQSKLVADSQMIQKMVVHVIKFIDLIGGRVESVKINSRLKSKVEIEFIFTDHVFIKNKSQNIADFINECEPIEARLSLAIVYKIIQLHRGKASVLAIGSNQRVLTIQLPKGR